MDRLISVVIPTFDRKALTDRAVESITPSCPDLFEIIVVDDCGTMPYAYDRSVTPSGVLVRTFRTQTNNGPGPARELGVEKSEGSIIAFLDSDDIFEPGWPDAIVAEVLGKGSAFRDGLFITGRTLGGSLVQNLSTRLLGFVPDRLTAFCVRLVVIAFNPFYTPATAISKQLCSFWTLGRYCEDYFTNAMAILKAKKISVLHSSACTISRSPGSAGGLSEFQRKMWSGEFQVRKSILLNPGVPLGYRMLVPMGMTYALARNIVKSVFRKLHVEHLISNPGFSAPEVNHDQARISRVAVLGTRGIPARYGGFETFAEKLGTGLSKCGFDVTVFCESGQSVELEAFQSVKLRYISAPSLGPLQTILYDLRCLWAARKDFDVVYMLGYGAAPFCVIPRLFGTEVWINPDGLEWARSKWGFWARNYFRLMELVSLQTANRIIADAEAIATSLASRHGKLSACTVIPYGCEIIEIAPSTEPLSDWSLVPGSYYLIVCRLEPENHVLEILQAFQRCSSKRKLIVVGNHLNETRYVAQLLAIQDPRIRMLGTIYDETNLTCLRYHCFAYFHGHSVGGTNPSLLEAMGCGNLIFAHDNPFNRETLGSGGFYFADAMQLTQAIERADEGSTELAKLREASMSRARVNYRWIDIISRYVELLDRTSATPR